MGDPPAPTARRLTAGGRATRARITAAAAALMAERGVAGTSVDEVRKAAGVSGSQVTHYFGNKRSLIRAVIECHAQRILGDPALALNELRDLRTWVHTIVLRRSRGEDDDCYRLVRLAGEAAELDVDTRVALAAAFGRWERSLRVSFHRMRNRRELRGDANPAELALALLCALQGGMLLARVEQNGEPLEVALGAVLTRIESFSEPGSDLTGAG
jgi:TetR/AcrR family transcriptional regulator, transcriptional repressor for nem operon